MIRRFLSSGLALATLALFGCAANPLITGGKVQITLNELEKAIELFSESVEQNPDDPESYFWLGIAYGRNNEYGKAVESFNKAIGLDSLYLEKMKTSKPDEYWGGAPSYWVTYINSGIGQMNEQNYQPALEKFLRAAEIQPESSATYNYLGYVQSKLGNEEKACKAYGKAVELGPRNLDAHLNFAACYLKQESNDEALALLEKAIAIGPSLSEDMSRVYKELGVPEETSNMESQGRTLEIWKYWSKGVSFSFSVGKQVSKETFSPVTPAKRSCVSELFGGLSRAYYLKGICQSQMGEDEEAEKDFRRAIERNAENRDAFYNLGMIYLKKDKPSEAAKILDEAVKLAPNDEDAWFQLGTARYILEEYEKAADAFTQVIELNPDKRMLAEAYENRGLCRGELGLKEEAYRDLKEAERLRKGE